MVIAVIDGMGGSIGQQIILQLRRELPEETEIMALGTNSVATMNMMKARANRGGTGENAIRVNVGNADVVMGCLSILIPNSMMGELTPGMAESIASCRARKIILPLTNPRIELTGVLEVPLPQLITQAVRRLVGEDDEGAGEKGSGDV
jgi:malic enzyme